MKTVLRRRWVLFVSMSSVALASHGCGVPDTGASRKMENPRAPSIQGTCRVPSTVLTVADIPAMVNGPPMKPRLSVTVTPSCSACLQRRRGPELTKLSAKAKESTSMSSLARRSIFRRPISSAAIQRCPIGIPVSSRVSALPTRPSRGSHKLGREGRSLT